MGRPKIKWDSLTYDDYDFDQLDKIKNKQINKIKSLQKKIDKVEITEVISGGPAWRENILEKGDIILKVRQENEDEATGILGMRLSEAVKLIKGEKGTKVYLTIKKVSKAEKPTSITNAY